MYPLTKTTTLRKYLIILLSCIILVPTFGSVFVFASFKLEQQEIIKTICVQRKMIFNTCNGRCELQKSLKKYDDNEKKMQNNLKEKTELVYIHYTSTINLETPPVIESTENQYPVFDKKPISVAASNFRPPAFFI